MIVKIYATRGLDHYAAIAAAHAFGAMVDGLNANASNNVPSIDCTIIVIKKVSILQRIKFMLRSCHKGQQ